MRVSPAIRVKGRIAREVSGFRKPWRPLVAGNRKSGPAACLHVRYVEDAHSAKAVTGFAKRMRAT